MYLSIGAIIRGPTIEVKRTGEIRSLWEGKQVWICDDSGASRQGHGIDDMNRRGVPPLTRSIEIS